MGQYGVGLRPAPMNREYVGWVFDPHYMYFPSARVEDPCYIGGRDNAPPYFELVLIIGGVWGGFGA